MKIFFLYIITIFNINTSTNVEMNANEAITATETVAEAAEIKWYTWEEAHELSKTAPKKIFVDLYTSWCGWCKKMDKSTFQDPAVVKYLNENFYAVKFNAEQKESITFNDHEFKFLNQGRRGVHQLAYSLLDGKLGYPSFVMLDETFARIMISPGFKQADRLLKELTFAKEEKYMSMSFEDFMSQAQ